MMVNRHKHSNSNSSSSSTLLTRSVLTLCLLLICNLVLAVDEVGVVLSDPTYRDNHPVVLEELIFGRDVSVGGDSRLECKDQSADILWSTETHSSIVSTPIITDLFAEGSKDIVLVNTNNYVDVIRGKSGTRAIGWPFILPESTFSSSPILYDFDQDGHNEIVVATREGEILFIHSNGMLAFNSTLRIPPLKVAKNWFSITDKHVDASFSLHERDIRKRISKEYRETNAKEQQLNNQTPQENEMYSMSPYVKQKHEHYEILFSEHYEHYIQANRQYSSHSKLHIWVDAHVLSSPIIADIDADGNMELIVAASYYYDHEYYADPVHNSTLDPEIDIFNYAAGGIVCFNLADMTIKWQTHLDLTADNKMYNGYVYGSPTVADINNDGMLETIIGTNLGLVYILDHNGEPLMEPINMDSIYAPVIVQDVNGDGQAELIATDADGNIICFNNRGEEIWSYKIVGMTESPAMLGDINGDGKLDVVVGTTSGVIYAFNAATGESLLDFPIKTKSSILSQILLVNLSPSDPNGLSIVVHGSDGVLYMIDTREGCTNKLDIGDQSFAMVLATDFTGNGQLDLLVSTFGGVLYTLSTNTPFTPAKERTSFNQERNIFSQGVEGIFIRQDSSGVFDVIGSEFSLAFDVVDASYNRSTANDKSYVIRGYYGGRQLFTFNFEYPGWKYVTVPVPERSQAKLFRVEMTNKNGLIYSTEAAYSFNIQFSRLLKWIIVLPFIVTSTLIIMLQQHKRGTLPM
ncbi:hypothetical protein SAMD00019534_024060 [Acytostelium subglobosum LB1]|uniref:hypothetical protein n=1 Tax=Acytostelium subglobosum LB1 TaxID=1410327 RepID=UPI0006451398|nr:hypothetical protein SAMD00019534_024060 [Acytostelium subglobosum LB1]GAM19231.1 hypothetical protein SAMD00019534_024060 [Acytostelium subglobosum LB1]|eukprot:XP_012757158.1 hypothetical protein SAMD00019534_024060 [Acytostelium subglobosum LB1]